MVSESTPRGYLATLVGTSGGALVVGPIGLLFWLVPCDDSGFDCLGPAILGVLAAMALGTIGAFGGCYLALRIRQYPGAGATAGWLAAVVVGATLLSIGVAQLLGDFAQNLNVLVWAAPVVLPLLARWLALGRPPVGKDRPRVEI